MTWRGPLSELTHTQCEKCNEVNCQITDEDGEDIYDTEQEAKVIDFGEPSEQARYENVE